MMHSPYTARTQPVHRLRALRGAWRNEFFLAGAALLTLLAAPQPASASVTPAAMIAGTLATMAVSSGEMSQFASWAAAIIVGGGTAGVVQMSTVAARGVSTVTTGGLGNFVVATGEWIGAILLSVSAMLVPALVAVVVLIAVILAVRWIRHKKQEQAHSPL